MENKFTPLSFEAQDIRNSLASVAGRISEAGRIVAGRKREFRRADLTHKRVEAECYIKARAQIEAENKRATEAQVTALVVTDPVIKSHMEKAQEELVNAECAYESARADYEAIKAEAEAVCEAARLARTEMANLDPVVRSTVLSRDSRSVQPSLPHTEIPPPAVKKPKPIY